MAKITLAQKAKKAGLPVQTVYNRRHAGWSEKKALSVPLRGYKKPKVSYKVEPKKVQTSAAEVKPVERKVPPTIPLPVEKYEAPKDKTLLYVVVACVVILVLAVMANT
jgi:hypothetical protein